MFLFKKKRKPREKLPPNQRWIDHILKWGEEHRGIQSTLPNVSLDDWRLIVEGEVGSPTELDWSDFMGLEQVISISNFHCVETWSVEDQKWEGVMFKTLMHMVQPTRKVKYVLFQGYDGYTTSLPLKELEGDDVLLAYGLNGALLPQPLGGPMRLVVPHKYGYKSTMWLHRITFSVRDKLGYWERGSHSNSADPWKDDR